MGAYRNVMPGFGNPPDGPAPDDLDYAMWLGPAPLRPYNPHRALYHFRWFWDYSGGQMTNLGAHNIDIVQWYLGVKGPTAVSSSGGRFALEDNGETPDTRTRIFEYPGFTAELRSARPAPAGARAGLARNSSAPRVSMMVSRAGYEVFPDMKITPPTPSRSSKASLPEVRSTPRQAGTLDRSAKAPGSSPQQFDLHVRNFLDCVKSRQMPIADVEDGHRTAVACHLANICLRTGRKIHWNPERRNPRR